MKNHYDVIVLGGGLAGTLFARQLRMMNPSLSVAIFERDEKRGWKVGESTVEIAANYLVRRQKLNRYLYMKQLSKNSLRFFFDNKNRDADITELSEIGVYHLPPVPSFQLDRARLEQDLLDMNRVEGTDVFLPATVKDIELGGQGESHKVKIALGSDKGEQTFTCTWVIDAAGRANLLAKKLDLRIPAPEHQIVATWGRASNTVDMDAIPNDAWQRKVRYTPRTLSTNHFCYPGYWIWFIPLSDTQTGHQPPANPGLMSLGVVMDRRQWKPEYFKADGFMNFMREHKSSRQLLEGAELHDVGSYTQLAYRTKRFWDSDARWGCIGDSGAFSDPFYSPGSDFISIENDCLTDLVTRDFAGENVQERAGLYNDFVQYRYETTLLLYADLYKTFGSYELFREKCFFDCASYYNLWVDGYMQDHHLDLKMLKHTLRRKDYVLTAMRNFNRFFANTADQLMQDGRYWRGNLGHDVQNGMDAFGVFDVFGTKRSTRDVVERTEAIFNKAHDGVLSLLAETDPAKTTMPKKLGTTVGNLPVDAYCVDTDLRTLARGGQPVATTASALFAD